MNFLISTITEVSILPFFTYHSSIIAVSSFPYSLGPFSTRSLGFGGHRFNNNSPDPYQILPLEEGINPLENYCNNLEPRTRQPRSSPVMILLQDLVWTTPNFLKEGFGSLISLKLYFLGRLVSLCGPFVSTGISLTNVVEELE